MRLHHKVCHLFCNWFWGCSCSCLLLLLELSLILSKFFFLGWFLKILSIIFVILFLTYSQFMLYFGNKSCNFLFWNFILFQDMRMLFIQLLSSLVRIWMKYQFLQQDSIHFFLGIWGSLLIMYPYNRRFVSHT